MRGGVQGSLIGLGGALAASFAAQRLGVPAYRKLTLPLKTFFAISPGIAGFVIGADSAARKYELSRYAVGANTDLAREAHKGESLEQQAGLRGGSPTEQARLQQREMASTKDILVDWGKEHRYTVVFWSWAASMVGSFGYISMTPLSFAQKLVQVGFRLPSQRALHVLTAGDWLVQARMVAQGLTVAVLIASAGLASIPTASNGGVNEDEVKRLERESSMYKWRKDSPHEQHRAQQQRASEGQE